jgi:predicted GH43/DUF377 family glycosyl hydrolase
MFFVRIMAVVAVGLTMMSNTRLAHADTSKPQSPFAVLSAAESQRETAAFNALDARLRTDSVKTSIPDSDAEAWLVANAPRFDCPDTRLTQTWWFRWWTYRKHLKQTDNGWIVTEFLPDVSWAGKDNSICCAAGHHLREGRWLRDPQYIADYARFWFGGGGNPRLYSFWAADSVLEVCRATGDMSLADSLLPALVKNYQGWEQSNQDVTGLFQQSDNRDGMEYSLGGSGYRPTINSYQYGDARAIAEIAAQDGQPALAREFAGKAAEIKLLVQSYLWNPKDQFFETAPTADLAENVKPVGIREEVGFVPWYFDLPDPGYETAWKLLLDPQGFAAPFGPLTAERHQPDFMHPEPHDCLWNGPSWPYATTQTLVAMANLLNDYSQTVITKADYLHQLEIYAKSQQKDGHPWIAEDLDGRTGKWIVDEPRSIYYNHSGYADLVITGLVGLRPSGDSMVVVNPLVPAHTWDWFCLDGVPYHGHSLTILWDKTGQHYGHGAGFQLLVDGKVLAHRTELGRLEAALPTPHPTVAHATTPWVKSAENPVLGGSLGTCFDLSVLHERSQYVMYFSWRPKQSIARTVSTDGIHWSTPQIVLGPAATGWEDDINRPCVVKRPDGYHLWYTGQAQGHSEIGSATSPDGIHWTRLASPVLSPEQPWEKVAVMCPDVLWDEAAQEYKMWYSGGDQYEPDAIGSATSSDGVHWTRSAANPVFAADPSRAWEQYKVTACQVVPRDGWYYLFYIGFRDIDHAQIGMAKSRDGLTDWVRYAGNPIVSPTPDGWDADACYKPWAMFDGKRWLLWYNGRHGSVEQIGLVTKDGQDLGF